MGRKDIVTKDYMEDCEVFADAFNFLIYGGRQVISPSELRPMDTAQVTVPYGTKGAGIPGQRYRDGLKYLAAMTDGRKTYLILGNENQSEVHYAMPVKNMLYDAMQYAAQVERAANSHRRAKDGKGHTSGEFLSGFYKEDRLIPVVTLVICFHGDRWDGPLCIHDMLDFREKEILPFVENYRVHLIEPFSIKEEELGLFHSSLREVVSFLKYSKDKEKLDKLLQENDRFQKLERKAVNTILECAGVELEIEEEEGEINVCKAWDDMQKSKYEEGKMAGEQQGIAKGISQGISQGINQGIFITLSGLVNDGILKLEEAAVRADMSAKEFREKMQSMQQNSAPSRMESRAESGM